MKLTIRADRPLWKDGIDLFLFELTDDKIHVHVHTVERKTYERHAYITDPGLHFTDEAAQQLFDELWRVGLRPRNGESSLAHVDALKYHLEDMRRLALPRDAAPHEQPQQEKP